jgi:hypothetical protein
MYNKKLFFCSFLPMQPRTFGKHLFFSYVYTKRQCVSCFDNTDATYKDLKTLHPVGNNLGYLDSAGCAFAPSLTCNICVLITFTMCLLRNRFCRDIRQPRR